MASVFYRLLKAYCATSLDFYFRKWEVHGTENIPDGPVIFVPNHQNAFLDAILVTCSSKKNPWFLTRANVFDKPKVASFLNKMQMLPVYRFRDGFATLKKNDQVMDNVVQKLNVGETILIFAEGSHSEHDNLAPLQKGVARMAMAVAEGVDVAIVPVGLRYESRFALRTNVLVNYGAPVYLKDIKTVSDNPQDKIESVLTSVRKGLQPLMLHIDSENYDAKQKHLYNHRQQQKNLQKQLESDQAIVASFPQKGPVATFKTGSPLWRNIMMWYVKLNSLIPLILINKMLLQKIKDPQFIGSVKFAGGMLLVPAFWCFQAFLIWQLTSSPSVALAYLASLVIGLKLS